MAIGKVNVGGLNIKKLKQRGFYFVKEGDITAIGDYFVVYSKPVSYENLYEIYDDDFNLIKSVRFAPGGGNYAHPVAVTMDDDLNLYSVHTTTGYYQTIRKFNEAGIIAEIVSGIATGDLSVAFLMEGKLYTKGAIYNALDLSYISVFSEVNSNKGESLVPNFNGNTIFLTIGDGGTSYDSLIKYTHDKVLIWHIKTLAYNGTTSRTMLISDENDVLYISDGNAIKVLSISAGQLIASFVSSYVGSFIKADQRGLITGTSSMIKCIPKNLDFLSPIGDFLPNVDPAKSPAYSYFVKKYKNEDTIFATVNGKLYRYQMNITK